jgi:hypothetical protein
LSEPAGMPSPFPLTGLEHPASRVMTSA